MPSAGRARIRRAAARDTGAVRALTLEAFPATESRIVADLAVALLDESAYPGTFALVAERDHAIVGHVAFSPVTCDPPASWQGYILAPLAVAAGHHGQGIGRALVEAGITRLSDMGVAVVFVYGDPAFYRRFGFDADLAAGFIPPHPLEYPFGWQALALGSGPAVGAAVRLATAAPLDLPELW